MFFCVLYGCVFVVQDVIPPSSIFKGLVFVCAVYGHVLLVQDAILLPPSLPIELQRTCFFLCPICSCFASCDSCSNVLCRTKKIVNMLPKEHHRQNRQKESQQIIGGGSQTGAQREREREAHFPTLFTPRTKSRAVGPSPLSPGDN